MRQLLASPLFISFKYQYLHADLLFLSKLLNSQRIFLALITIAHFQIYLWQGVYASNHLISLHLSIQNLQNS